jgi:beta-N-acetylhexosaminidase
MKATNAATACGYVLGAELRACGVDFSFTPVLDLDWGGSSVIGDRASTATPRVVAMLAKSLMHGLLQAGMANCGKHFPGHGFVRPTRTPRCRSTGARSRPSWPTTRALRLAQQPRSPA